MVRRRACIALAGVLLLALPAAASSGEPAPEPERVFAGLGSWLDIFASDSWANPAMIVARAKADGVRTLYLQTSNYSQTAAVVRPAAVGRFVDAAHAAGMRVVAWYLPGLERPQLDARRALAAIRFRSRSGQAFDGFALDIEASIVGDVRLRNHRLLSLARLLRRRVGGSYPLGAIVPSPIGMERHPHYWPAFPYAPLAETFDAFLPMAYFSYYAHTPQAAFVYARRVITMLRAHVGPQPLVHMIAGSSTRMPAALLQGFAEAVAACGAQGISLYAFPETSANDWDVLRHTPLGPARRCA